MSVVLVTGATGFLGSEAIARLVARDCTVAALVRGKDSAEADLRLRRTWWDFPDLREAIGSKVRVVVGDVRSAEVCDDPSDRQWLVRNVTHVLHTAADLRLDAPQDELDQTNVEGTLNVLRLANEANRDHGLEMFAHVSTAYIGPSRSGVVEEEAFDPEAVAQSNYERSKLRGEAEVRRFISELPIIILRPGMVVGDSRTGRIRTFNTIYYPLRLYLTGKIRFMPVSSSMKVNLIPIDEVAKDTVTLLFDPDARGKTFHLVAPDDGLPTVGELVEETRKWAKASLRVDLPSPVFFPLPERMTARLVRSTSRGEASNLSLLTPYFSEKRSFSRKNVDTFVGPYALDWREFLPHLLEHAAYAGFLHQTGRIVHEQILFRLGRERRRISCHDIVGGEIVAVPNGKLRGDCCAPPRPWPSSE